MGEVVDSMEDFAQDGIDMVRGKPKAPKPPPPITTGAFTGTPEEIQAQLAVQLFEQSAPLRTGLIDRSSEFLSGGDVTGSPSFQALQESTARNFSQAKDNVIARTPAGGPLIDALVNLEGQRASTLSMGEGALYEDELGRALTLGTGTVPSSLGALGNVAAIQAQKAEAEAARGDQKASSIGTAGGYYLGSQK